MKSLRSYILVYWKSIGFSLLFLTCEALCDLLQPTIMARIVDRGIAHRDMHTVLALMARMFGITAFGAIAAVSRNNISSIASTRFGADLRSGLFKKIQTFSFSSVDRFETGSLVTRLTRRDDDWLVELQNGEVLRARTVFLANGKHDLRGWERGHGVQGDLIGFKMHWQLAPAQIEDLRGALEMFLFRGGYGALSLVEGDAANLCLVVRRSELRRIGGWSELLADLLDGSRQLRKRLHCAKALWDRPLAISPIPYGYLVRGGSSLWCIGDQAAVIPSFTGNGMSIALHSGRLAAEMFLAGAREDEFHRRLHKQLRRGMSLATLISRAMVTGAGRMMMPHSLSLYPNTMRWIAASTRIPEWALLTKPVS